MKKILLISTAVIMVLSFAACKGKTPDDEILSDDKTGSSSGVKVTVSDLNSKQSDVSSKKPLTSSELAAIASEWNNVSATIEPVSKPQSSSGNTGSNASQGSTSSGGTSSSGTSTIPEYFPGTY